jgi:hypothetical protein
LLETQATPLDSRNSRYAELAESVAEAFLIAGDQPVVRRDFHSLQADLNVKIVKCGRIRSRDELTQRIAVMTFGAGNDILKESKQLEILSVDSGFSDFAVGLLSLVLGQPGAVVHGTESLLKKGELIEQQRLRWVHACNDYLAARLMLPDAARQFGGPEFVQGDAVTIDFDESFAASADHDAIRLTNSSGSDLTNCTVLVEIIGKDGESSRNVHFAKRWTAGGTNHAKYGIGLEASGGVVARRTVYGVHEVWVSVWADELSDERIRLKYRGPPRDADIARILDGRIMVRYRYDEEGGFFRPGPIVTLGLEGVPEIPEHTVTLVLESATEGSRPQSGSWSWSMPKWTANEQREFSLASVLTFKPSTAQIKVTFADSGYEYLREVTIPAQRP